MLDYTDQIKFDSFIMLLQDEDITTDDSLNAAAEKANIPREKIDELIAQIKLDHIKEELKRTTQEALDSGVRRFMRTSPDVYLCNRASSLASYSRSIFNRPAVRG